MKKIGIIWIVILIVVFILSSCSYGKEVTTAVNESHATETEINHEPLMLSLASASNFYPELKLNMWEFSKHKIQINTYPRGVLGSDSDIVRGVKIGTISIMAGSPTGQTDVVPELALLDIPYIFEDTHQCSNILNGNLFQWFQKYYNEAGLQLIAWRSVGFRQLTSSIPVNTIEDIRDLKIRTMENPYHQEYWSGLGANVRAISFDKLLYSLQQGGINSQENALRAVLSAGFSTVQKYIVITNHLPFVFSYVMNKDLYDSLSTEEQEKITQYFDCLGNQSEEVVDEQMAATLEQCQVVYGMTVINPDEKFLELLKEGNQKVINLLKENLGEDIVEEYLIQVQNAIAQE